MRTKQQLLPRLTVIVSQFGSYISHLQVREFGLEDEELIAILSALQPLCKEQSVKLIVNGKIHLMQHCDGVHLGSSSISLDEELSNVASANYVGYSAHSFDEAQKAISLGVDYLLYAPIFSPLSKDSSRPPLGISELAKLCSVSSIPVYALGGISVENVEECKEAGAAGVGSITSLFAADNFISNISDFIDEWNDGYKTSKGSLLDSKNQ